jgi:hypothetical protein
VEASGERPGPDPFLRAKVVCSSERTRISRLFLPGRTVVRKETLGPETDRRVRHEGAMLERLRGVVGVTQLARAPRYPGSVALEDAGQASLAGMTRPLPARLSEIIMHLLEKEPDHRYQTADALIYDSERLRYPQAHPAAAAFRVGERDVPGRLLPPS